MTDGASERLTRAKAGDVQAFGELVVEHQSSVFSVALHFLRNRSVAEEVAQDVFLDLFQHLRTIESTAHLGAWLRRDALNRCIDRSRRRAFRMERAMTQEAADHAGLGSAFPDVLAYGRMQEEVANLVEEQRAVVILRYGEDLLPSEIAETLQVPVNTVKSRLHRALGTLRQKLEKTRGQVA